VEGKNFQRSGEKKGTTGGGFRNPKGPGGNDIKGVKPRAQLDSAFLEKNCSVGGGEEGVREWGHMQRKRLPSSQSESSWRVGERRNSSERGPGAEESWFLAWERNREG